MLALPRGGEFLYGLLTLTGLSLDGAWRHGRKARRLLGIGTYFQFLGLLLACPLGLEVLARLLEAAWLRYLAIVWYPFGAALCYCYFREVYMGRRENNPETVKASEAAGLPEETAEVRG